MFCTFRRCFFLAREKGRNTPRIFVPPSLLFFNPGLRLVRPTRAPRPYLLFFLSMEEPSRGLHDSSRSRRAEAVFLASIVLPSLLEYWKWRCLLMACIVNDNMYRSSYSFTLGVSERLYLYSGVIDVSGHAPHLCRPVQVFELGGPC